MNIIPPQSGFRKFLSASVLAPFVVSSLVSAVFIPYLHAANKAGAVIDREPKELSSGASFGTGIAPDASWSKWEGVFGPSYDPLAGFKEINHAPVLKARDLAEFNVEPADDTIVLDQKMTMLVADVLADARQARQKADVVPAPTVNGMTAGAEGMYAATDRIYRDIGGMYKEIGSLQTTLDNNYKKIGQDESASSDAAAWFNGASDAMAGRVARMNRAVDGMAGKVTADAQNLGGMRTALEHMGKDGEAALQYYDQLQGDLDTASRQYKIINSTLQEQDPLVYPSADAAGYFKQQKDYLKSLKTYVQGQEINQLAGARKYLSDAQGYQQKVLADLRVTQANLQKEEDYFRNAKVGSADREKIEMAPADPDGENVCTQAEIKGLDTLKNCAKSCRTVCRWKKKVQGQDCYECPSGSPDTCYDVGAWPADHPWCQPGGICYSDPMMYCVPFGTIGPNLGKLQCTNCKQRQDMCWQKVGGGMTYTNCKMGCWNGKCVYKGKYQEAEWDGKPEFIHCYECKLPPPAPTCEELGWGYDWQADCEKDCPDPGVCEEKTMPPRKGPKPPIPIGGPGGGQDGPGGGDQGGQQGGDTGARSGGDEEGPDGKKPTPPTGTPEQPTGGGGSIAGGKESPPPGGQPPTDVGTGQEPQKPETPGTTAPSQPEKPNTQKPDVTDGTPPEPPDNQEIRYLRTRIAQTAERIKDREEIINDPREGDSTKTEAASRLEDYQKELDKLKEKLKAEEEKELERQREAAEEKSRGEAAARERDRTRTRWPDPKVEMQKIRLKELKEAIDRLKTRAQEILDEQNGRKEHIDRLNREIDLLEREIQHHKDASESGGEDATHARNTIENIEKELARKKSLRDELDKKLEEAKRQHAAELDKLKNAVLRKLYAVDETIRRREETKRIDEYYDKYIELEHVKASRDERNRAFEAKFKDMESQIAAAKASGDDDTAEKLQEQLDNMKRGKEDWDKRYATQIKNLEDQLFEMGYHRNFTDGVGPTGKDTLAGKLDEYGQIFDNEITATERKIAEMEQAFKEGRLATSVGAGGVEHVPALDQLKERLAQLRASREGITEKQNVLKEGYRLPEDIAENIRNSTERYAEGSKNVGADKSFARLFAESLGEEAVHNMNPLVAAKKSVAFGWGVAQGVGTAVKGLADLGYEVVDTLGERIAVSLGFESGGIFGTEGIDALDSAFSTLYSNANFDGIIKATVAMGGMLDAELKKLEKAGDIDWATAKFGGKVAGEVVVGDVVIAGALGKAATLVRGADEAADAARLAGKTAERLDDAADAARTAGKLADDVPTGTVASKADDLPGTRPHDTPPARAPPEPRTYNNRNPLPDSGRQPTHLADDVLEDIEKNQGFKKEHAERMNEFAQEHDTYLLVRDGNPESVKFFDDPDMMAKPMSSKAKTAKVGPETNRGLVVDPTHPTQSKYWDEAVEAARKSGDTDQLAWLEKNRQKAVETWQKYGDEMLGHGYRVNPDTGVIEYVEKLPDGTEKVWKGIHGDYDLHGAYRKAADGTMESVSFGSGQKFDGNGFDVEGTALRQQLNDKITGGTKDFIQHGGQDDWVPDPHKVPNKPPDPPVTVFFPDGRPPMKLENAQQMKNFYEGEMGVKWPYPDP